MTMRYFKATDGTRTMFRASATRVYCAAKVVGWTIFTSDPHAASHWPGYVPCTEITRAEYQTLVKLKQSRMATTGRPVSPTPNDSWVYNSDLIAA